jgi:hypothetical protein
MNYLTSYFLCSAKAHPEMQEAIDIMKNNSRGKLWLTGGFVYRNIAHSVFGIPKPDVDLDFIVEIPVKDFKLPPGWTVEKNRFGNPKFVNGNKKIDYVPLNTVYSINYREIEPTIENYLTGTPLTIQSVAYDVFANKIIVGPKFMNALTNQIVEVQNLHLAEYSAEQKKTTLNEMIQKKADELQFTAVFPEVDIKPII